MLFNRACRSISFTKNGQHCGLAVWDHTFPSDIALPDVRAMVGWKTSGIKEMFCTFGQKDDPAFVANLDQLMCQEEALHNPGVWLVGGINQMWQRRTGKGCQ